MFLPCSDNACTPPLPRLNHLSLTAIWATPSVPCLQSHPAFEFHSQSNLTPHFVILLSLGVYLLIVISKTTQPCVEKASALPFNFIICCL